MLMDLREEWNDLLKRRPALQIALAVHGEIVEHWARLPATVTPLAWSAEECRERWDRRVPLLAELSSPLSTEDVEPFVDVALGALATLGEDEDALGRFADRWNDEAIRPSDLFPRTGRIGVASLVDDIGLRSASVEFLALVALRPSLQQYFSAVRPHLVGGAWLLGICPYCGAPPGFADVVEDGSRRLACHVCGGAWRFSRTRCPYCGTDASKDLVRLELGDREAGYFVAACKACSAYVKELDRRMRWNGGSALVEDWGSPHFDLAATRQGYWRPGGSLIQLTAAS